MKRIVFTFGTLFVDEIIKALLGDIPDNFYAALPGHAIYKGTFSQLPQSAQDRLKHVDRETFSFLFAKTNSHESTINGRAYEIDLAQELVLDHWELYPDWYRKKAVTIFADDGSQHEAFIYTVYYAGEELTEFNRVVNEQVKVVANARAARARVIEKFPEAFR